MTGAIGVDLGGTNVRAARVDTDGESVEIGPQLRVDTPSDAIAVADAIAALVHQLDATGELAVGIGLAGWIGLDGVMLVGPHTSGLEGFDLAGALRERGITRIGIDNDANCVALAAQHVDHRTASPLLAITLGTGIGGGVVLDGAVLRGQHGMAGEPGHVIVDVDGPDCACGQQGCWETRASGSALSAMVRNRFGAGDRPAGDVLDAALRADEPAAGTLLDDYATWVAVGLVGMINLLDPAVIVLGGGVSALGEPLRLRVDAQLRRLARRPAHTFPEVVIAAGGPDAGLVGAALSVLKDTKE